VLGRLGRFRETADRSASTSRRMASRMTSRILASSGSERVTSRPFQAASRSMTTNPTLARRSGPAGRTPETRTDLGWGISGLGLGPTLGLGCSKSTSGSSHSLGTSGSVSRSLGGGGSSGPKPWILWGSGRGSFPCMARISSSLPVSVLSGDIRYLLGVHLLHLLDLPQQESFSRVTAGFGDLVGCGVEGLGESLDDRFTRHEATALKMTHGGGGDGGSEGSIAGGVESCLGPDGSQGGGRQSAPALHSHSKSLAASYARSAPSNSLFPAALSLSESRYSCPGSLTVVPKR